MEMSKWFAEPLSKKAEGLLKVYEAANEAAAIAGNCEDKILVYNEVITSCMADKTFHYHDSLKRNKILYWAYHNMGDMLAGRGNTIDRKSAIDYYYAALNLATENHEKRDMLGKIASAYKELGDVRLWMDVCFGRMEYLETHEKRAVCLEMAKHLGNDPRAIKVLEKALEYVSGERIPFKAKCVATADMCIQLEKLYKQNGDAVNATRIQNLRYKAQSVV